MKRDISEYSFGCKEALAGGIENSFYTHFENLLRLFFSRDDGYTVINNAKGTRLEGHPDIQIKRDNIVIVNIEAKPPSKLIEEWIQNPSLSPESIRMYKQIGKYHSRIDVIVLITDFKMIWWTDMEFFDKENIAPIPVIDKFLLLEEDLSVYKKAGQEISRLVKKIHIDIDEASRNLRDIITNIMPFVKKLRDDLSRIMDSPNENESGLNKKLKEIESDLQKTLFKDTKRDFMKQFVDLYTQLITYGMIMGWLRYHKSSRKRRNPFSIFIVDEYLPNDSLLQNMFDAIKRHRTEAITTTIFDPIENILKRTDHIDVAEQTGSLMNVFYSDFLEEYDKDVKKDLGVVYTDERIVDFQIRGIDYFLKKAFTIKEGVLDTRVKYLDPASGTMAYPCGLMREARKRISDNVDADETSFGLESEKDKYFNEWFKKMFLRKEEGLGNVFGFEVLMAPYILGHLRTLIVAEGLGATIDYRKDKVQIYLINSLMDAPKTINIDRIDLWVKGLNLDNKYVKTEVREGIRVRNRRDIMVVMGNPPYNISSQNSSKWITGLVDEYINPEVLNVKGRKKVTGLTAMKDDYIKFIRFAQWKIADKNERGIVSYITNRKYIKMITARGMRHHLYRCFDEIWIMDLHGDWKEEKQGLDGNVFGIDVGVAISFFIRYDKDRHKSNECLIKYAEIWGTKEERLENLKTLEIDSIKFTDVPKNIMIEFIPSSTDIKVSQKYNTNFVYLPNIFKRNTTGITTGHDSFVSNADKIRLISILGKFYDGGYNDNYTKCKYVDRKKNRVSGRQYKDIEITFKDIRDWKIFDALELGKIDKAVENIVEWQWRGFDKKYISYYEPLLTQGSTSFSLMQYLLPHQNNICLIINRQSRGKSEKKASSSFITNTILDNMCNEGASGLRSYAFPLKINNSNEKDNFNNPKAAIHYNINESFLKQLPYWDKIEGKNYKAVFYYIYGVLYSPTYRATYRELIAKEYPRIPFPSSKEIFEKMVFLGKKLADYHLLLDNDVKNMRLREINENKIERSPGGDFNIKIRRYIYFPSQERIYFDTKRVRDPDDLEGKHKIDAPKKDKEGDLPFYIGNITNEMWNFEIGGIMQLNQWLRSHRYRAEPKKDYITRGINQEELKYFIRVCNAIAFTINLRTELDTVYHEIESNLLEGLN